MIDRKDMIVKIDSFFSVIIENPKQLPVDKLIDFIEAIIPVHVELEITSFDDVDVLLSVYPYLHQKLIRVFAFFIHEVRVCSQKRDTGGASESRDYRDAMEQLIKAVRLQYDALSRRITNSLERR